MIDYVRDQMDSDEEVYSCWYLRELIQYGILKDAVYHPPAFQLSDPVYNYYMEEKMVRKKLVKKMIVRESMKAHLYTADWKLIWDTSKDLSKFVIRYDEKLVRGAVGVFQAKKIDGELITFLDIKGGAISPYMNSSAISFSINQKWTYSKFGIFCQKCIPIYTQKIKMKSVSSGLFVTTFTPKRYLMTDGGTQARKLHYQPRTFLQYYNG